MKRLFSEAKDERPGMRYKRTREMGAPEGMSSSPIGKDYFNPEVYKPRTDGPKDVRSAGVSGTKKTLSFALDIVAKDPNFRDRFNGVIAPHFQLASDLRVELKRLEGILEQLGRLEKTKARLEREKTPDLDKIEKVDEQIDKLTEIAQEHEIEIKRLDEEIEQNINDRSSLEEMTNIIKGAAESLGDSMSDKTKQQLANNTLKSLADLNLNIVDDDPELRLFLKEIILNPESFDPLEKLYELVLGQRKDAKDRGTGYYFINPMFMIGTMFKTALDKSLRAPKKPTVNPHVMRKAAKSAIGAGLSGVVDKIKKDLQPLMSKLYDYEDLDDRDRERVDSKLQFLKDEIRGYAGDADPGKVSKIIGLIDDLKTGDATERDVVAALYTIREGYTFRYDVIVENLLRKYR
jgi:hypothetical protein